MPIAKLKKAFTFAAALRGAKFFTWWNSKTES
jgi:hypothetical protein